MHIRKSQSLVSQFVISLITITKTLLSLRSDGCDGRERYVSSLLLYKAKWYLFFFYIN